jgi:branched-chain amino acid transport system substrate-binding protein
LSVGEGVTRPSLISRKVALAAACTLLAAAAVGCGGEEGVADGAEVTVYVVPPQCEGAERDLERYGGKAGQLRVKLVCLENAKSSDGRLDLATVGANARRAVEDSSTVGYIEAPGRAVRFSLPILEEAQIPLVETGSGATSMARLLDAIQAAGTSSGLRETVGEELE